MSINLPSHASTGDRRREEATPAFSCEASIAPPTSPRSVIRGETLNQPNAGRAFLAHVDWIAFSLRPPSDAPIAWLKESLQLIFGVPADCWRHDGSGWQGFTHRVDLGELGLLAFGGAAQRGAFYVSLNAKACARVSCWQTVRAFAESTEAVLKRLDLAHDDFEGASVTVDTALTWYSSGLFSANGRPPRARLVDDLKSNDGRTLYVGHRKNGKLCRVYEKGKELGDRRSPWVRCEVEFRAKGRLIPWEAVLRPGDFLAGAYPCLAFLSAEQCKVRTTQRISEMTYDRMRDWLSGAGGKALNVMYEVEQGDAERVLRQLVKPGRPKRLLDLPLPTSSKP